MSREDVTPEEVLDLFLFEDVYNNTNHFEDDWDITFVGNEFLLRKYETGEIFNLRVEISPGTLTEEEKSQLAADQEWYEEEEDD